ncbi:MAG: hypothetical protein AAGF01_17495 [Cyanobacteria bacterium P01_G01_bin.38]
MPQLDQSALQARNRLFSMFLVLCALDALLVFIARDLWAIGRILLTIAVMYFVLQGRQWAKWLLIGLCSLLVVALVALVLLSSQLSTVLIVGSWLMIMLSAIIPIYMTRSQALNRYFSWKRQNN